MAKKIKRTSGGLPPELTTVTPLSKTLAFIAFLTIPIIAFFWGMRYQQALGSVDPLYNMPVAAPMHTTMMMHPSTSPVPSVNNKKMGY